MFQDITQIDMKILSLYVKDYKASYSIREITKKLGINYPNAFKRVNLLVKKDILLKEKKGHANDLSVNIRNIDTIQLMSYVEEIEKVKNNTLYLLIKEVIQIDPFACIGVFGSRASGKAKKGSDWDIFIITQSKKTKKINKIMNKFPHAKDIQLQVFSIEEFEQSLLTREETVVKHIIRNKKIIYNPHPFYNIIYNLEMIKYAPTQ